MNTNKPTTFKFRVDSNLKNQAAKELNALGITMSDAIRLYLRYIVKEKKIPPEFTDNS